MLHGNVLTPEQQQEMYEDVKQIKRILVGEKADGEVIQVGIIQRVHKLEKAKRDNDIRSATISGLVAGVVMTLKALIFK